MSLLPSSRISPETWRVSTLSDYVYWFRHMVDIDNSLTQNTTDMVGMLFVVMLPSVVIVVVIDCSY